MIDQLKDLEYEEETLLREFEKLTEIKKDLNSEESQWIKKFSAKYDYGFKRGVSEKLKNSYLSNL